MHRAGGVCHLEPDLCTVAASRGRRVPEVRGQALSDIGGEEAGPFGDGAMGGAARNAGPYST